MRTFLPGSDPLGDVGPLVRVLYRLVSSPSCDVVLYTEVKAAWLAHGTLATWALSWQLVPAGSLLPSVVRAVWRQALTPGLPKFSDVFPVV